MALMNESTLQRRLNELERFVKAIGGDAAATVTSRTGPPTGLANEGDIVFDTTDNVLYVYTDGLWVVTTTSTWIRYASEISNILDNGTISVSGDAVGFTDTLNRNVKWIGEAFLKASPVASNSPTDYTWRLAPAGLISDAIIDESAIPGVPKNLVITEELYQTNNASGVRARVQLTWVANVEAAYAPTATTLVEYKPQYIGTCSLTNSETGVPFEIQSDCESNSGTWVEVNTTDSDYVPLVETPNQFATTPGLIHGVTDFRLTAVSKLGVKSISLIREDFTVAGVTAAPLSPANLSMSSGNSNAVLTWDRTTELDVSSGGTVQIRIHPSTGVDTSWSSSQILVEALSGATTSKTVPLMVGTYLVKFVDSGGRFSSTASTVTNSFASAGFNFVSLSDEHAAGYLGLKTNCVVNAGDLEKNPTTLTGTVEATINTNVVTGTSTLFTSELAIGDWVKTNGDTKKVTTITSDTSLTTESLYTAAITAGTAITKSNFSMTYDFAGHTTSNVDLGIVKSVKITPNFDALIYKAGTDFCSADSICNLTQVCTAQEDAEVIFYISRSDDLTTWTGYERLVAGNYSSRAFRFRVTVAVAESTTLVDFQALSMALDTVDIIQTGSATTSATADVTNTYANAFYTGIGGTTLPRIGTQVTGGAAGDTVVVALSSATSFSVSVYNNGSRVVRAVDWQAIGQ